MIHADVLADRSEIERRFQHSKPFRHVVIDGFLEPAAAEALLADFPRFDAGKAINELGEVGRKAVVESVAGLSPFYRDFYRYINSKPFLAALSTLTGIPKLIADNTLFGGGTHENLDRQSLDMHVDFNVDERRLLHRRLNLLIYLNKEWDEAWGGAIELHSDPWNRAADQVTSFLPLFNRALIFETSEYSWHGFTQIVLPADRKHLSRKSFSIYLYTADRPVDEVVAPHTTFYVPRPLPAHLEAGVTLTEHDAEAIHMAMASREGLIRMYQKLLIEKAQRLHDFMTVKREARERGQLQDYERIVSSRSWRLIMKLHRLRARLVSSRRKPDAKDA